MPRSLQPDRKLFVVTLALCFIGVVMVFSASAVTAKELYGNGYVFLERQIIWLAVGLFGMIRLMNFDYRKLREPHVIYSSVAVVLLMLIGVLFLDRSHATHRWIHAGPLSLQPSEFAKLVVILYLAWFLELRLRPGGFGVNNWNHTLLPALGPVIFILALILREPDMGTSCMIFLIALVMLYEAGMSMKYVAGAALGALPAVYLLIVHAHYRYERMLAFFSPGADPQGRGFQLMQSLIAVGSGGLTGVGLMESKQKLLSPRSAHGFHLRRFVRGDRLHRRNRGCDFVWNLRVAWIPRGVSRAGCVWPLAGPWNHHASSRPGACELERGARVDAHEGNSAALY